MNCKVKDENSLDADRDSKAVLEYLSRFRSAIGVIFSVIVILFFSFYAYAFFLMGFRNSEMVLILLSVILLGVSVNFARIAAISFVDAVFGGVSFVISEKWFIDNRRGLAFSLKDIEDVSWGITFMPNQYGRLISWIIIKHSSGPCKIHKKLPASKLCGDLGIQCVGLTNKKSRLYYVPITNSRISARKLSRKIKLLAKR